MLTKVEDGLGMTCVRGKLVWADPLPPFPPILTIPTILQTTLTLLTIPTILHTILTSLLYHTFTLLAIPTIIYHTQPSYPLNHAHL